MATNFDFSKIRSYNNSKNGGFEELVCQLAHLERIDRQKEFVRKEGAGGDAGLECYWKLDDNTEIGWQAKYFNDGMNPSRWNQISDSFKTAIQKHPLLKKYIVCLPVDRTDVRKSSKSEKKVLTIQSEWDKYVNEWNQFATGLARSVEFQFWGRHEIVLKLTIDDPLYSGRALYWFEEPVLNSTTLANIAENARVSLGERYSPEFHVELPISKSIDGLCANKEWWRYLSEQFVVLATRADDFFRAFLTQNTNILETGKIVELQLDTTAVLQVLSDTLKKKEFKGVVHTVNPLMDIVLQHENRLFSYEKDIFKNHERERSTFLRFFNEVRNIASFLSSTPARAAKTKFALVYGEAGIGKSHLLCDVSLHRLKEKLPTVFLLGSQYSGGKPIEFIRNALDLGHYRSSQVLGALDAAGEAARSRTLIVIDAINEGSHRAEWYDQIRGFIQDLSRFPNICTLVSCRVTYLRYLIPDTIDDQVVTKIEHRGFAGYEHRAAEKYLSSQGISKPGTPILAPEFSNPLFLKTCCAALKSYQATTFPKGLRGVTSLFDFYVESMERTISRKKAYNESEEIVRSCLKEIAARLFPDNLSGISVTEARKLINNKDPNLLKGNTLFEELLHEGVISEDISYLEKDRGIPVIRFTYERFSDQFVAEEIIAHYTKDTIADIFSPDHPAGKLIAEERFYAMQGIFEALAIFLAEKYRLEFIDLLPETPKINRYHLESVFFEAVVWRSADSFSGRTLELLNSLQSHNHRALDILLRLSTEPGHPWNAELLHRNLISKKIADRDHYWSIHIADNDWEEGDDQSESIVRTLINWSARGDLKNIESERARLCAVTMAWFLTTSNRRVRDQATKSLVRLLTTHRGLLPGTLDRFSKVDDLYLLERLYAVAYGVVCNTKDRPFIKTIAKKVYELVFSSREPLPHLLLRDYARGILEVATHFKLLPNDISPENFRPPYISAWPLENPTEDELNDIAGDTHESKIRDSLMGFPGDFGRYTMSSVHDWSATVLTEVRPKTGIEYKKHFAETVLTSPLKERYLDSLSQSCPSASNNNGDLHGPDDTELFDKLESADTDHLWRIVRASQDNEREQREVLFGEIRSILDKQQNEYFRWLCGLRDDAAAFSRKWAQRWICKRAYSFGWTKKLFEHFERTCSYGRGAGYGVSHKERIGKKYQWIAYHEFLAHLADNVHWIKREYSDMVDDHYEGPWQIHARDIDPTIWIRESGESGYYNKKPVWWQSYHFPIDAITSLEELKGYLWNRQALPDFTNLVRIRNLDDSQDWLVLNGFWSQKQEENEFDKHLPRLDAWFRINSMVIAKRDYKKLSLALKKGNLVDPETLNVRSTQHQTFFGEYPWHKSIEAITGWQEPNEWFRRNIPIKHFVPVAEYEWEQGSRDYSINDTIRFYMPSKELLEYFSLARDPNNVGCWINGRDEPIFLDPSVREGGPSYALIRPYALQKWLDDFDLEIVWLIGGEKQLFSSGSDNFYGRLTFNGLYRMNGEKILGDLWYAEDRPDPSRRK